MGTRAIVGSANLSEHSRTALDEAALHTSDRTVVHAIREWFDDRMGEPVTPKFLAICKKVYRPPKGAKRQPDGTRSRVAKRRVWLIGTEEAEFPKSEAALVEAGSQAAKKVLQNRKSYLVETIRWTTTDLFSRSVRREDVLVESFEGRVYSHGRVLNVRRRKLRNGKSVVYVFHEALKEPNSMTWGRFRVKCEAFGLRLGLDVRAREIRDVFHQNRVLSLTSPEKK